MTRNYGSGDLGGDAEQAPITASGIAAGRRALNTPSAVAERQIDSRHQIAKNRVLPMRLQVIENLKKEKIHLFNIGPWSQAINTGSTGTIDIPECPRGTPYVEAMRAVVDRETGQLRYEPPISIIVEEFVIKSEDEMSSLTDDGWGFAMQVIGKGRGSKPGNDLTKFGIFASRNPQPTEEELSAARGKLEAYCKELVKWAADTFIVNRDLFSKAVRPSVHFKAAQVLGRDNPTDSPWMMAADPIKRIKCKMCGRLCDPDVATCEAGHVVNMELYLELQAADEQLKAAVQAKPSQRPQRG